MTTADHILHTVRNSTVYLGQELQQFLFWNYFLVVSCEEFAIGASPFLLSYQLSYFSINTQVIIQNRALSLARYLGLSADNHLDGQNGCQ